MNEAIKQELERLRAGNGGVLEPRAVVEAARMASSPLHSWFEWDDSKAAEAWRLEQARRLIRVVVEVVATKPTRVYVHLPSEDAAGYRKTSDVLADDALRDALLNAARDDWRRFEAKYRHLKRLAVLLEKGSQVFGKAG